VDAFVAFRGLEAERSVLPTPRVRLEHPAGATWRKHLGADFERRLLVPDQRPPSRTRPGACPGTSTTRWRVGAAVCVCSRRCSSQAVARLHAGRLRFADSTVRPA